MLGIIVVCHKDLAVSIKLTASSIIGNKNYFEAVEVLPIDAKESVLSKIKKIVNSWDLDGILIFVDIFGGTPCNASLDLLKENKNIDVITGVNLPMILFALSNSEKYTNISDFVENVLKVSNKSILNLKSLNIFKG